MNERIRQLVEKSYIYDKQNDSSFFNKEKFAELIILDCIDIVAPYTVRMSRPGEEYLHPIQEIKKNFGIK